MSPPSRTLPIPTARSGAAVIALVLALSAPDTLSGQTPSPRPARAWLEPSLEVTAVHGDFVVLPGGSAGVRLAHGVEIGGGGWMMPSERPLAADGFRDLSLTFGFAGATVGVERRLLGFNIRPVLLLGAGNADVVDAATGLRLASDNFFVARPAVSFVFQLPGPLRGSVGGAWRWTEGVEDLPGAGEEDLRGVSLNLGVRFGG